ncbi:MAG: hypothetical protein DME76_14460 [Verrucomicrobia bacterium]|nr:MAG: hypothetical protein DME76_14460 [Verrucomicrobiota bacterium]
MITAYLDHGKSGWSLVRPSGLTNANKPFSNFLVSNFYATVLKLAEGRRCRRIPFGKSNITVDQDGLKKASRSARLMRIAYPAPVE